MTDDAAKTDDEGQSKTQVALMGALHWLYEQVAGSEPGSGVVSPRMSDDEIDRQIAYYCTAAGTAGFMSNVGGVLTLAVALPANLIGVAALQLRLIAEIAKGRGYSLHSQEVRTVALACLTGGAAIEIIKEAGIQIGIKMGQKAVGQVAGATLIKINQAVGFRLITKAGSQGVVNLTKFVPVIGGVVGGTVDALSTKAVGEIAKKVFVALPLPDKEETVALYRSGPGGKTHSYMLKSDAYRTPSPAGLATPFPQRSGCAPWH